MKTVREYTDIYIDRLDVGEKFSPKDVCAYVYNKTGGRRDPMDGTITRMIRYRREEKGDVDVCDKHKSVYIKKAVGASKSSTAVKQKPKYSAYKY